MRRLTGGSSARASATAVLGLGVLALAACTDDSSTTDLTTEGPPMVRQVFVSEKVLVGSAERIRVGLAFGTHPDISEDDDDGRVDVAVARGKQIRVVLDELVKGNALEELACNDMATFSRVPDGATPDDVANCSGTENPDCKDICIGPDGPIGILDANFDGAADNTRLIDYGETSYGVNLECGGERMALDQELSFYNPSGNQQIPAGDIGINGLGPALVLFPVNGMKTGSECTITFRDEVTDRDGNLVCAPPGGDVEEDCPGKRDTSLVTFTVEPLVLEGSDPAEGAMVQPSADPVLMVFSFNASISPDTVTAFSLSAGGTPVAVETVVSPNDSALVQMTVPGGLTADTDYVITITTDLTDVYGGGLPETVTINFSTGPGPA